VTPQREQKARGMYARSPMKGGARVARGRKGGGRAATANKSLLHASVVTLEEHGKRNVNVTRLTSSAHR